MKPENHYLRGAFAVFGDGNAVRELPEYIVFRFNPEQLSRSFQMEQARGEERLLAQGGASSPRSGLDLGQHRGGQSADAASGPLRERFSVQVRFDFDDRHQVMKILPANLGIAPEIAALEMLVQPGGDIPFARSTGRLAQERLLARPRRPTLLFIWGRQRILPVRITSLNINETMFNAELNPLRAEAEVGLEVLSGADASSPVVQRALAFMDLKRRALARLFHSTSAAQGTSILPL
jgi:hypothetical protein